MIAVVTPFSDTDISPWLCPINRQPLSIQIAEKIRIAVQRGYWESGQKLPNEIQLCETFEVSRGTLREAIGMLVFAGIVIRRHGSGTYVAEVTSSD